MLAARGKLPRLLRSISNAVGLPAGPLVAPGACDPYWGLAQSHAGLARVAAPLISLRDFSASTAAQRLLHQEVEHAAASTRDAAARGSRDALPRARSGAGGTSGSGSRSDADAWADASREPLGFEPRTAEEFEALVQRSYAVPVLLYCYHESERLQGKLLTSIAALAAHHWPAVQTSSLRLGAPEHKVLGSQLDVRRLPALCLLQQGRVVGTVQRKQMSARSAEQLLRRHVPALEVAGGATSAAGGDAAAARAVAEAEAQVDMGFQQLLHPPEAQLPGQLPPDDLFAVVEADLQLPPRVRACAMAGLAASTVQGDATGGLPDAQLLMQHARQVAGALPGVPRQVAQGAAWVALAERAAALEERQGALQLKAMLQADSNSRDPATPQLRYALAVKAWAEGNAELGLQTALQLAKKHWEWRGQAGRKLLDDMFDALGEEHALTREARGRLARGWFEAAEERLRKRHGRPAPRDGEGGDEDGGLGLAADNEGWGDDGGEGVPAQRAARGRQRQQRGGELARGGGAGVGASESSDEFRFLSLDAESGVQQFADQEPRSGLQRADGEAAWAPGCASDGEQQAAAAVA